MNSRINDPIKFCNHCGYSISLEIPEGDNRPRHVCKNCGEIQYQNPKIVAGCIPSWEDKILICRRAIEPRYGYWTIPAGFMENDETIEEGAQRETWEEAEAKVINLELFQVCHVSRVNQIYMLFRADLVAEDGFGVGAESLEVKLTEAKDIPWDNLAFKVIHETLKRFLQNKEQGKFEFQINSI